MFRFIDETATASSEEKNSENPNGNENDNETENEKEKEQKEEEEEGGEAGNDEDGGAHFNDDVRTCIRHIILFIIYDIFIMQRNSYRSLPGQM